MKQLCFILLSFIASHRLHADDLTPTAQPSLPEAMAHSRFSTFLSTDLYFGPGIERSFFERYSVRVQLGYLTEGGNSSLLALSSGVRIYFFGPAPRGWYFGILAGFYRQNTYFSMFGQEAGTYMRQTLQTGYQWILGRHFTLGLGVSAYRDLSLWDAGALPNTHSPSEQSNAHGDLSLGWTF